MVWNDRRGFASFAFGCAGSYIQISPCSREKRRELRPAPTRQQQDQPQIAGTKKGASKGAFFSDLVEPGGFEPPSASTPLSVLHA